MLSALKSWAGQSVVVDRVVVALMFVVNPVLDFLTELAGWAADF